MTVVVAGFDTDPPPSSLRWVGIFDDEPSQNPAPSKEEIQQDEVALFAEALESPKEAFLLADSLLSREVPGGRLPVADSAEKIFEIGIEIAIPDFDPLGHPTGRVYQHTTFSCGVGYAGSSAMCHLTLERFRQEMKSLRYTWIDNDWGRPGKYAICQKGASEDIASISDRRLAYDDEINFSTGNLPPLEAEIVANIFALCFNEALMDHFPKEAQIARSNHVEVAIEFVLLAFCQKLKTPKIYRFSWEDDRNTYPSGFKSVRHEVPFNELAVLGHTSWTSELLHARNSAIASRLAIESSVRASLAAAIKANSAENYVGGSIRAGRLDSQGFQKRS
jgi:hypothetical protein